MNFREVNKKLNEIKQSDNKQALEQFRNTKISNVCLMKKFIFTILNEDCSLPKSIILAKDLKDAHQLWVDQYGSKPFRGNLNIEIM